MLLGALPCRALQPKEKCAACSLRESLRRAAVLQETCVHPSQLLLGTVAADAGLGWAEVMFTGWGGMRGSVSLIMIADFIANRWDVAVRAGGWE